MEKEKAEQRLIARHKIQEQLGLTIDGGDLVERNPTEFFKTYRDVCTDDSENESDSSHELDSDDEVHDIEEGNAGGVSVIITD